MGIIYDIWAVDHTISWLLDMLNFKLQELLVKIATVPWGI